MAEIEGGSLRQVADLEGREFEVSEVTMNLHLNVKKIYIVYKLTRVQFKVQYLIF